MLRSRKAYAMIRRSSNQPGVPRFALRCDDVGRRSARANVKTIASFACHRDLPPAVALAQRKFAKIASGQISERTVYAAPMCARFIWISIPAGRLSKIRPWRPTALRFPGPPSFGRRRFGGAAFSDDLASLQGARRRRSRRDDFVRSARDRTAGRSLQCGGADALGDLRRRNGERLKEPLCKRETDDADLFHGCPLRSWDAKTSAPWHIAMPSGGGIHSINHFRDNTYVTSDNTYVTICQQSPVNVNA